METLRFRNPTFKPGMNFTVRLGEKWKERVSLDDLVRTEGCWGFVQIRLIYICKLDEIPEEVLENEHDPKCRTWRGLVDVLKEVYPELQEMDGAAIEETTVTCLGFWLFKYYHKGE